MKKQIVLLIYVVALLLITGCSRIPIEQEKLGEIVFKSLIPGEMQTISFVNSAVQMKYVVDMDRMFSLPIWSNDGKRLFGLVEHPYGGYPSSINIENGKIKKCEGGQYYQQIQDTAKINHPFEVILMDAGALYLYDMANCEVLERLVYRWDNIGGVRMFHFSYSPIRDTVVYGIVKDYKNDRQYEIISLKLRDGQSRILGEGINPSLSSDEERIAYLGTDGFLYIMNFDGSDPELMIDKVFFDAWGTLPPAITPIIQWSPDDKWLVYHRCEQLPFDDCNIYKFNVQESIEELVIKDGVYPDWNPKK